MAERVTDLSEATVTAGHNWWAGLVGPALDALRHAFRLNEQESAAWDLVTNLIKSLV